MAEARYEALRELIDRYRSFRSKADERDISEETVRVWLNEFLGIFGWDVQDTAQVLQERQVSREQKERLETIRSEHTKPDYTLVNGRQVKTYLDAKKLSVDLFRDREAAFQIRSYGWSAGVPCAFLSNFEQLVIFDCGDTPRRGQEANVGAIQLDLDRYLSDFGTLEQHLCREQVYENRLEELYHTRELEGRTHVDEYFNKILSEFRIRLANEMYQYNRELVDSGDFLDYYVQVILDRIVFIRVCESRGVEKAGLLREFRDEGFWRRFRESCYLQFYLHYDGAMFDRDEIFGRLVLTDEVFNEFIDKLYYPYPYRFDVIPVRVLARVYEEFLSYGLVVRDENVRAELKEDYVRTNGAVPTREFVVDAVRDQTLTLEHIRTAEELFAIRILDPCCGSGVFLVSVYEKLLDKLLELAGKGARGASAPDDLKASVPGSLESPGNSEIPGFSGEAEADQEGSSPIPVRDGAVYQELCVEYQGKWYATAEAKRTLMQNCLYGIDYDQTAVEVTKMSLALKLVDDLEPGVLNETGMGGDKILRDIHRNIVCGNTLAGTDIELSPGEIPYIRPVDLEGRMYRNVFREKGGFDYIVGNPPYVETKYFKAASARMHEYLKTHYQAFEGKADLAVLFLERCLNLLNPKGRLGFIIQRRWFKTAYGRGARRVIAEAGCLEKLFDIKTTGLFEGRITYVSVMVLNKAGCPYADYHYVPGDFAEVRTYFERTPDGGRIPSEYFSQDVWSPEFYEMDAIKQRVAARWGTLGDNRSIHIRDGIQALWKKVYHITDYTEKDGILTGKNGFGEEVNLETEMVKPVIYNRVFTPLKRLEPDAYCLFPYKGTSRRVRMPIEEIQAAYPLAFAYLTANRERIQGYVKCNEGSYWHTFTREHNHEWFESPKIIIPMTARDTVAAYEGKRGLYMDNSNVWFLNLDGSDETVMKGLTMLINSTVFNVFAKSGANPQSGGYYKFNKQFLTPVPVPNEKLTGENEEIRQLAGLYDEIEEGIRFLEAADARRKLYYEGILADRWDRADELCVRLYELKEEDLRRINEVGRVVDRVTGESGENE